MALHVHPLVLKTAKEMAETLFEAYAQDNVMYAQFRRHGWTERRIRRVFVARVAPRLYEEARQTLAGILAGDYPQLMKDEVYDALCKDNLLRANRTVAASAATVPVTLH